MIISKSFIRSDFPVVFYKGRTIVREEGESLNDILDKAKRQIDAEIEDEIRAVVEKILREREST